MAKSYTTEMNERHGHLWVVLPDSIDMDNYLKIEQGIIGEVEMNPRDVALDFSRTKALFSSGIGLIVRIKKLMEQKGLKTALINMEQKIKEGLENVGLYSIFDIYDSEDDFINAKGKS